jgi:hypothetical protein
MKKVFVKRDHVKGVFVYAIPDLSCQAGHPGVKIILSLPSEVDVGTRSGTVRCPR